MKKYSLPLEKLGIGFMPYLSLIVPVYNRPQEVQELLESLAAQDNRDFEIIIVEDGSTVRCVTGSWSSISLLSISSIFLKKIADLA